VSPEPAQQRQRSAGLDGTVDLARDRDLVERCQGGDRTAFEELYHRYHRRLFHFCLRRLHEPYEAEDAVQEAFTKAWRALPRFAGERRFYPWLTVIAGNVCTDILRRRSRLTPVDDVPLPLVDVDSRDVDELVLREVDTKMVVQALGRLSDRHQRVLQLREGSGWTTRQIAEHEGVAVPAMETLLWRARQALKREFAALAETGGRLGIALGLGAVALRRFVYRTTARAADRVPVLQSVRGPGVLAASLVVVVASGVAAGVATSGGAGPADNVAMPPAAASAALAAAPSSVLGAPVAAGSDQLVGPATAVATNQSAGPAGPSTASAASAAATPAAAAPAQAASPGTSPGNRGLGLAVPTLPGAASATGQVGSAASSAVGNVGSAVSGVVSGAGSTASSVVGSVGSVVGGVGSTASSVVGSVSSTVSSIVTDLAAPLEQLVGGLSGTAGGAPGGSGGLPVPSAP
jgi:RNA polymerase sigma-70 factor (ECF subfamily)